ncbi:alpha/beta hydrolase [Nocardia sp. NPDC051463]|uniref:alpha/beta hydrolase n=1 Tax=Nocardia sp. NPDC051463 TaxID=3154845 RepID=UPI00344BDBB7
MVRDALLAGLVRVGPRNAFDLFRALRGCDQRPEQARRPAEVAMSGDLAAPTDSAPTNPAQLEHHSGIPGVTDAGPERPVHPRQCASRSALRSSTKNAPVASSHSIECSVRIESLSTASLATRLAPTALTPFRWALTALTVAGKLSPITTRRVFTVTGYTDGYAAPLAPPRGTQRTPVTFEDQFHGEWLWHDQNPETIREAASAILYIHGGAFITCGLNTHRRLAAKIGRAADMPVLNIAYRQLPHAHITDTIDDCVRAYRYLLDKGFPADRIILAGDSAGGGLTLLTAMTARQHGLPMPAGIVALSPFADLDNTHRLTHPNAGRDAYIPTEALGVIARWGFQRNNTLDPSWSPINGDFTDLPPVLIQVGSTETLLSDAERLAQRCAEANVPCTLQIWDRAPHVFQAASDLLPEARNAIHDIATFARHQVRNSITHAPRSPGPTASANPQGYADPHGLPRTVLRGKTAAHSIARRADPAKEEWNDRSPNVTGRKLDDHPCNQIPGGTQ